MVIHKKAEVLHWPDKIKKKYERRIIGLMRLFYFVILIFISLLFCLTQKLDLPNHLSYLYVNYPEKMYSLY
jgi:hypothetical protein